MNRRVTPAISGTAGLHDVGARPPSPTNGRDRAGRGDIMIFGHAQRALPPGVEDFRTALARRAYSGRAPRA